MGIGARLGAAWRALLTKSEGGNSELAAFLRVYGGRESRAGQTVTAGTALEVATVLACVRVLADGIAQVPLKLYRARADGRGADPAVDHPLYDVLSRRPNAWQTSYAFRETMMFHLPLCWDFVALKNRVGRRGEIRELIPMEPARVEIKRETNLSLRYFISDDRGQKREIPADDIWHVRGPSWNSWVGMDAIKLAREAIGLTMAIEGDQARFYENGLRTSGGWSVKDPLNREQHEMLMEWLAQNYTQDGAHKPLILDRGAQYFPFTMTGVDAQTLESRKHQVEEICRAFRVIPLMVGHSDKTATYASAEQMFIAHVVHTLAPWAVRIEQSVDADLLTDEDRRTGVYAKFNLNGLQRGAFEARTNGYSKGLGAGGSPPWMTQNEVRALEEMNPVDDPDADRLAKPTNPAAPSGTEPELSQKDDDGSPAS